MCHLKKVKGMYARRRFTNLLRYLIYLDSHTVYYKQQQFGGAIKKIFSTTPNITL